MIANNEQTKHLVFFIKKSTSESWVEEMDIVVYGSIAGRFYDKARSLFMHRGGKMKFGAVKSLGMYHHFWRVILLGFSIFVLLNV